MDSRGRITIPKEIRDYLGIRPRDKIIMFARPNQIVMYKLETFRKKFKNMPLKKAAKELKLSINDAAILFIKAKIKFKPDKIIHDLLMDTTGCLTIDEARKRAQKRWKK